MALDILAIGESLPVHDLDLETAIFSLGIGCRLLEDRPWIRGEINRLGQRRPAGHAPFWMHGDRDQVMRPELSDGAIVGENVK